MTAALALAMAALPAAADAAVPANTPGILVAVPISAYATTGFTIEQGGSATFVNLDEVTFVGHDVRSKATDGSNRPLFTTPVIKTREMAEIEGVSALALGSYEYRCSLHSAMTGTLTVTPA
ncbi:MAG TPA: hypothetical protein VGB83_06825 [Actinomycetota bacterium]